MFFQQTIERNADSQNSRLRIDRLIQTFIC